MVLVAFAVIVKLVLSVPSMDKVAPLISKAPVVVISTSSPLPAIFTPPSPERVNDPLLVVKLESPPASIVRAPLASISNVDASISIGVTS